MATSRENFSPQTDLRDFLEAVEQGGQLEKVDGAHWDKEMGAVVEVLYRERVEKSKAVLFDNVPGYPEGFRCLYGMLASPMRLAIAVGMDTEHVNDRFALLNAYREKMFSHKPIPPNYVDTGPVMENTVEGDDIDITKLLPVPIHHELDGGRYIGTACGVITRDLDTDRINSGTYRCMVHDGKTLGAMISNGKQGNIHRAKYFEKGLPCPMTIVVGVDPTHFLAARMTIPDDVPEFDFQGGLAGKPIDLIVGDNGLPFPANSEIVIEGEQVPNENRLEGPFGEWTGYYAGDAEQDPVFHIKKIYHRNNPILTCAASQRPPHSHLFERCFTRSVTLLEGLQNAGVQDVRGVWHHEAGSGRTFVVVSIKQRFYGHATQAGLMASQLSPATYCGRYTVVVDEDIDASNLHDVVWAMGTRSDPARDITHLSQCQSSRLDPMHEEGTLFNNRVIINACRPYERLDTFPAVAQTSPELAAEVRAKFPAVYKY
ncbi:MAG: UbiD family decarboxylase [Alphaproteobacteria bacterium]